MIRKAARMFDRAEQTVSDIYHLLFSEKMPVNTLIC